MLSNLCKEIDRLKQINQENSLELATFKQKFDPKNVKCRENTRDKRNERLKEENAALLRQFMQLQTQLAQKDNELERLK